MRPALPHWVLVVIVDVEPVACWCPVSIDSFNPYTRVLHKIYDFLCASGRQHTVTAGWVGALPHSCRQQQAIVFQEPFNDQRAWPG